MSWWWNSGREKKKKLPWNSQNWKKASLTCIIENTESYREERTEKN